MLQGVMSFSVTPSLRQQMSGLVAASLYSRAQDGTFRLASTFPTKARHHHPTGDIGRVKAGALTGKTDWSETGIQWSTSINPDDPDAPDEGLEGDVSNMKPEAGSSRAGGVDGAPNAGSGGVEGNIGRHRRLPSTSRSGVMGPAREGPGSCSGSGSRGSWLG